MNDSHAFPTNLLDLPAKMRLDYFDNKIIAHPMLQEVHDQVLDAIHTGTKDLVIYVIGPTGVGKSTLGRGIVKALYKECAEAMLTDPGMIPCCIFQVPNPDRSHFEWKDCYTSALEAMQEPLISRKIQKSSTEEQVPMPGHGLRRALISAYKNRHCIAAVWDEGQHLTTVVSGRRLQDNANNIKYIAEASKTIPILIGTAELFLLPELTGQLGRRTCVIPFFPYSLQKKGDRKTFEEILYNIQCHIPHHNCIDLVAHYEIFYELSMGCVGVLHNWILRTLSAVYKTDKQEITLEDFERNIHPPTVLLQIAKEIEEARKKLIPPQDWRKKLRNKLGLRPQPQPKEETEHSTIASQSASNSTDGSDHKEKQPKPKNLKPGESKPRRDPVGIPHPTD